MFQISTAKNYAFCSNTTHVVFKDGLLSTYKKASEWNIPVVSILWIEACKVQRKLCDPVKFPISNIHMYEYPELFGKIPVSDKWLRLAGENPRSGFYF